MANQRDFNDFVDTIIAEAAGEGRKGMVAVASVINNRATVRGQTVGQVVRAPNQFDGYSKPGSSAKKAQQNAKMRAEAEKIARDVMAGKIEDPTGGADHFYSGANKPGWASKLAKTVDIGGHKFHQSPQAASKLGNALRQTANTIGDVADAVTAPVRQVAAGVGNMASALRTAAFPSMSPPPRPSVPVGNNAFGSYSRANLTPGISNALDVLSYAPQAANIGINSGYRSPTTNAKAGGASRSQHLHGNAVDIDISRLSPADRTALLDLAIEKGNVKGVGVYPSGNSLHIDTRGNPKAWGPSPRGKYSGLSPKELNQLPEWAQDSIKGMYQAGSFRVTPRTTAPTPTARPSPPDTMMAAPVGKVERAPLQAAAPRAPDPARFAYDTQPNPERFGPRGPTTTATTARLPSSSIPEPNPARFAYDIPTAKAPAPERFGYGLVSPAAAATPQAPNANMSLADQYASYGAGRVPNPTPALNAMMSPKVGPLPQSFNPVAGSLMAPISPPTLQPPAPVPVTTPTMPRLPSPINQRISQAVDAPPVPVQRYTAADIYNGQTGTAQASGGNSVSRFENNPNTYVTNQYGVTTATGPGGNQMAVRGTPGPGIGGPLGTGGISTPQTPSNLGSKVRGGLGTVVGGGLGGFLAGPVGAALGAVVAGDLARGRNPLDRLGIGTFDMPITDQFGFTQNMRFANPQRGGPFPNAPSGAFRDPTFSNRSDKEMRSISPKAADAISKGQGGLY